MCILHYLKPTRPGVHIASTRKLLFLHQILLEVMACKISHVFLKVIYWNVASNLDDGVNMLFRGWDYISVHMILAWLIFFNPSGAEIRLYRKSQVNIMIYAMAPFIAIT